MGGDESELEQNPYMSSLFKNPPHPVPRPINTNRAPNPYHPNRGTRHLRNESRLGTYSPHSEPDMIRFAEQSSSALVAAATGPSSFEMSRPRVSPLGAVRQAHNAGYYETFQKSSKSNKRSHAGRDSANELSEHEDDDFSQASRRRLAPTPLKQRKSQPVSRQRHIRRYLSDEEYEEELPDENRGFDQDAEEEEALMRAIAQRDARKSSPLPYKTPAAKRRKRNAPSTQLDGILYPTPGSNTGSTLKKKPKGKPVPQDLKTADMADRMMFRWKNAGRPWDEIREEYHNLTGTRPAASSLSVRFIKLNENLAANGFKNEIHDSFFETHPDRKYLKNYTKPDVQEVALLRAVEAAKIKQAQAFWKEVVIQIKATTELDFAAPSLRKRYEELKRKQFFLGEQNPAKDNEWPPLQGANNGNGNRVMFGNVSELHPINPVTANDHAHRQSGGKRTISRNTSNDSLFTDSMMGDAADFESMTTANGKERSSLFVSSKGKGRDTSGGSRSGIDKENDSPSHSHPRVSYGNVDYTKDMASDGSIPMDMNRSTPTRTITEGTTYMVAGGSHGKCLGPHPALVSYGDSDDSD